MFITTSLFLLAYQVPLASSLSLKPTSNSKSLASGGLRGASPSTQKSETLSFLSVDQAPGEKPAYVKYGQPDITTFNNLTSACRACVEFWPAKEDGLRFHEKLYEDPPSGGVWERACRAGPCDFRDPQTDPVGGIIGKGQGPDGKPDDKTCITREPVKWFSDCEPVLYESSTTMLDATRYCSYKTQMFIPPPAGTVSRFAGSPKAWNRIGSNEQCLAVIEKEGSALYDTMTFCDTNMPALSGCCETVYQALNCVGETAGKSGGNPLGMFATAGAESAQMLQAFEQYCVPLCENTKEEFCAKNPNADVCVDPTECVDCTKRGGLWCPKLETCHCPSKNPPCLKPPVTAPLTCPDGLHRRRAAKPAVKADDDDDKPADAGPQDALCKYKEMANKWRGYHNENLSPR